MRVALSWFVPMDTWPGALTRNPRTRALSSRSCAARATAVVCSRTRAQPTTRRRSPPPTGSEEEEGHEPGHPRSLLRRTGSAELLPRLGAAGTGDVAAAETEIPPGGVALCGGEGGARPGRRVRARRAGRAAQ